MAKKPTSIIFLDVDGVLNDMRTDDISEDWDTPSPVHLKALKEIVDRTQAAIVLTSSWRLYQDTRARLQTAMAPFDLTWYDVTEDSHTGVRGNEIRAWLHEHPEVEHFVILDDEVNGFNGCMANKFVKTSSMDGLLPRHVDLACAILGDSIDWDMENWLV